MSRVLEKMRKEFQGSAEALIAGAQEVVQQLKIAQEADEGNERLLRHYVSVGAVDKPLREGRDAVYGFRHLAQYLAVRRLLAEGFPLAKIARYTSAVPTDDLARYLEKKDRASEAELLVAAFRAEGTTRPGNPSPVRRATAGKPLPSSIASMGMVDVMHAMREMEQRMRLQLDEIRKEVHARFAQAAQNVADEALHRKLREPAPPGLDPMEFKRAIAQLAHLMDGTVQRLEQVLRKPIVMIEEQMDQQCFLFEEAHRQQDLLEKMFDRMLLDQRAAIAPLLAQHTAQHEEVLRPLIDLLHGHDETQRQLLRRLEALEQALAGGGQTPALSCDSHPTPSGTRAAHPTSPTNPTTSQGTSCIS